MAPFNYDKYTNYFQGMPWMQQRWAMPMAGSTSFTGTDANGAYAGGGQTMPDYTKTGMNTNYAPGQIPGAAAQIPYRAPFSPTPDGAPSYGQTATPTGTQNPFLTNSAMTGISAGLTPFDPQYLDKLTQSLTSMQTRNLNENVLPWIQQAGQSAGQYGGGSRQSLAQGVAMRGMGEGIANTVAPLYQQGNEQALGRNLSAGSQATQGLLGLGNLDIGRMNAETNAASAMANAAGAPQYSNPWLSSLGGAIGLGQLFSNWGK